MKVVRSSVIGYCFGVANSIDKAGEGIRKAAQLGVPCYSIGAIIHNKDVVSYFEKQGMTATRDCRSVAPGVAVIRAHGFPVSTTHVKADEYIVKFLKEKL